MAPKIGAPLKRKKRPCYSAEKVGYKNLLLLEEHHANQKNAAGETALHIAARYKKLPEIIQLLLTEGHARPDIYDNSGYTPLHQAIASDSVDIFYHLIMSTYGNQLILQSTSGDDKSILMQIATSGVNPLPFIRALENHTSERMRLLQQQLFENEKKNSPNSTVSSGIAGSSQSSPLLINSPNQNSFLNYQNSGNHQQHQNQQNQANQPLPFNPTEIWDELLAKTDKKGRTVVHWCAAVNNTECLKELINADHKFFNTHNNINIDAIDENQETALFIAASEGNLEIVELLLRVNCNLDQPDHLERSPAEIARKNNYPKIEEMINLHRIERAKNPILPDMRLQAQLSSEKIKNKTGPKPGSVRAKKTAKRKTTKKASDTQANTMNVSNMPANTNALNRVNTDQSLEIDSKRAKLMPKLEFTPHELPVTAPLQAPKLETLAPQHSNPQMPTPNLMPPHHPPPQPTGFNSNNTTCTNLNTSGEMNITNSYNNHNPQTYGKISPNSAQPEMNYPQVSPQMNINQFPGFSMNEFTRASYGLKGVGVFEKIFYWFFSLE